MPPATIINSPETQGVIAGQSTQGSDTNPVTIETEVVPITVEQGPGASETVASLSASTPGPLESLSNGGDSSSPNETDGATIVIANSLDGDARPSGTQTFMLGMLKQVTPATAGNAIHGVPPADQDFSSWGNEALWQ